MWASTNLCLNINYKLEEFKMELNVSNEEYVSIFSLLNEDFLLEEYLEIEQEGIILIPMNTTKASEVLLYPVDECIAQYDTLSQECVLKIESFAVIHTYDLSFILSLMNLHKYTDYDKFKEIYSRFTKRIMDATKQEIRKRITTDKGNFVKDKIDDDTYFQLRLHDDSDIYFIINKWWDKIKQPINFVDVGDKQTVFIARN